MGRRALFTVASASFALLFPVAAHAADLQLAVVVDHGAPAIAVGTVEGMINELERAKVSVELALLHVPRGATGPCAPSLAEGFTTDRELIHARLEALRAADTQHARKLGRDPPPACDVTIDVVPLAIDQLAWRGAATKRIYAIGRAGSVFTRGRTTIEEAAGYAARHDVVLHAVDVAAVRHPNFLDRDGGLERVASRYADDVVRFLTEPTSPLGRVPSQARHATMLSGGTFHVRLLADDPWAHREGARSSTSRELEWPEWRWASDAWGPTRDGRGPLDTFDLVGALGARDALDALALGHRRPSEVTAEEVPKALANVDLEPLLDAIYDYVDARRALEEVKVQYLAATAQKSNPIDHSALVARELLEPRKRPPSRR